MNEERDVRSLAEDIQNMVVSYTSFMEGIALQDADLAWELADKYAYRLRDMIREAFADLSADASEGLRKPAKKQKRRRKKKVAEVTSPESVAGTSTGVATPMGAEELPENPGSMLSQLQDPEQVDSALEQAMRNQNLTNRSEGSGGAPASRFNRNNPTMKRIED